MPRSRGFRGWEARQKRDLEISHAGDAMDRLFERRGWTERIREQVAVRLWAEAVDERVAQVTEALSITNGVLKVSVSNPVWRHELSFLKDEIRSSINRLIGSPVVSDIKFK